MPNVYLTQNPVRLQERYLLQLFRLRRQAQRMGLARVVQALSSLIYRVTMGAS